MQATATTAARTIPGITSVAADDNALIDRIKAGDQGGLAQAYSLHGQAVLAAAFSTTRRKSLAEDVTQEVFIRLWNRVDRYDPDRGSLRAFLKIDARGRSIDAIRSERSRREREDRDALMQPSTNVTSIEQAVMRNDTSRRVRALIAKLPAQQRSPIALAYFDGHSYREVARILDEPEGTIKSRIRAGLASLQGLLTAAGIESA